MRSSQIHFNVEGYTDILCRCKSAGYRFLSFDAALIANAYSKCAIFRHDIDFSLDYAAQMAEIEAKNKAISTYFIMLNCDYYNVLSMAETNRIRDIVRLGHAIGIHWDSTILPPDPDDARRMLASQIADLRRVSGAEVNVASQHVPTDSPHFSLEGVVKIDTYDPALRARFQYVSDSSMSWRGVTPLDLIKAEVSFQFLSHPIWWIAEGTTSDEKMKHFANDIAEDLGGRIAAFNAYMNKVLSDRKKYDDSFRANKNW
jgi:hypothetical protein